MLPDEQMDAVECRDRAQSLPATSVWAIGFSTSRWTP